MTTNFLGGKHYFLGIMFVMMGVMCLAISLLFLMRKLTRPRRFYHTKYK